jgi:arylsulfatase A-like enzyme
VVLRRGREEGRPVGPPDQKDVRSVHRTEATTDIAIERLRRVAGGRFALFVSYQNPHYPEQPAPKFEAMYAGRKMHRRPNCRDIDPYTGTHSPPRRGSKDPAFRRYSKNLDEYLRLYYAMVAQLDDNVGRLMAELERLGLADSTVVMFSSDHGDMQGSHGRKNKRSPYEESSRIPFIVRAPGGRKGYVAEDPVSGIDVYPSCLSYAGLPKEPTNEGADLAPLTLGLADDLGGSPVFSELDDWAMIRHGDHKLVVKRPSKNRRRKKSKAAVKIAPTQLFDLKRDPYEMRNLVQDSASKNVRSRLFEKIVKWHERVTGA